jgi:hypothetical protein
MDNRPIGIMDSGVGGLTVSLKKNIRMKNLFLSVIRRGILTETKALRKSLFLRKK